LGTDFLHFHVYSITHYCSKIRVPTWISSYRLDARWVSAVGVSQPTGASQQMSRSALSNNLNVAASQPPLSGYPFARQHVCDIDEPGLQSVRIQIT